jgi:hypothetical protein
MILFILFLIIIGLGILFYFLHQRVEKISKNQAIMVQWCDTLRENEEHLLSDYKRLMHEIQDFKKDSK